MKKTFIYILLISQLVIYVSCTTDADKLRNEILNRKKNSLIYDLKEIILFRCKTLTYLDIQNIKTFEELEVAYEDIDDSIDPEIYEKIYNAYKNSPYQSIEIPVFIINKIKITHEVQLDSDENL